MPVLGAEARSLRWTVDDTRRRTGDAGGPGRSRSLEPIASPALSCPEPGSLDLTAAGSRRLDRRLPHKFTRSSEANLQRTGSSLGVLN